MRSAGFSWVPVGWRRLPVAMGSLDCSLQARGARRGSGLRALEFRQLGKRRAWQGLVAISTRGTPPAHTFRATLATDSDTHTEADPGHPAQPKPLSPHPDLRCPAGCDSYPCLVRTPCSHKATVEPSEHLQLVRGALVMVVYSFYIFDRHGNAHSLPLPALETD